MAGKKRGTPHGEGTLTRAGTPACGARKKQGGGRCTQPAGWGTGHVGEGRCRFHGGATPIKHGRYSTVTRERVKDLLAGFEAEPDPLNTLPEINLLRALAVDYLERADQTNRALLAWYGAEKDGWQRVGATAQDLRASISRGDVAGAQRALNKMEATIKRQQDGPTRPKQVPDQADAYRIVAEVTRAVERHEKGKAANAISRADFARVLTEMTRVVDLVVDDEGTKERIRRGWLALQLG